MGLLDIFKRKKGNRSSPAAGAQEDNSHPAASSPSAGAGGGASASAQQRQQQPATAAESPSSVAPPQAGPSPSSAGAGAAAAGAAAGGGGAAADPPTKGGYLVFDSSSNGSLYLVYNYLLIKDAFAFFKTNKNIPEFKFKDNSGKIEIFRNLMQDKQKYYEGFCQFFKAAAEQRGECELLPGVQAAPLKVQVAFLDGTRVMLLQQPDSSSSSSSSSNTYSKIMAANKTAVACIPKGDNAFNAQTLAKEVFLRNARRGGAAITL